MQHCNSTAHSSFKQICINILHINSNRLSEELPLMLQTCQIPHDTHVQHHVIPTVLIKLYIQQNYQLSQFHVWDMV